MPRSRAQSSSAANFPSVQTAAERAREKKLRDDPMAIVIDALYVDCRRCGTRIKLSSKSLYDTFHWRTHRARCLKKPVGMRKSRRAKETSSSPTAGGDDPLYNDSTPTPSNVPSTPESSGTPFKTNLDLLTTVASAAAMKGSHTAFDEGFDSHPRNEMDEWRLRQDAIESLTLLSRSA